MPKTYLLRKPQQACTKVGDTDGDQSVLSGYIPVVREVAGSANQLHYVDNGLKHELAVDPDDHLPANEVAEDHDPRECPFADRLWNGRP